MSGGKVFVRLLLAALIFLVVVLFVWPISVSLWAHWNCNQVRDEIASGDLIALNEWATNVFEKTAKPGDTRVSVNPRDYCDAIKAARPMSVSISKESEHYVIRIFLTGAFIPTSVIVSYDKNKPKDECVRKAK